MAIGAALLCAVAARAQFSVVSVSPQPHTMAERSADISVTFGRPVDRSTVTTDSFWAFARWSGAVHGDISFSNGDRTITLSPDNEFFAAESVLVILSNAIRAADSTPFREGGYSFRFGARGAGARFAFRTVDTMTTRTSPGQGTRSYGGVAADVNHDGWADLAIVNEDSADVRVFLNRANNSGLFDPFLQPPSPVEDRASPSETGDFDRDGITDICVANLDTASVSILRGRGDGTFDPQQIRDVGQLPRAIGVLDADGDGDLDIVNSNANSGNCSILYNDGSGAFSQATFFNPPGTREWSMDVADMNEDGLMDLVIADFTGTGTIFTMGGNGDGTFSLISQRSGEGFPWVLNAADLNGDGHIDVATANSTRNTGSIFFGDGTGALSAPDVYRNMDFAISTDLGDLDGDGDMDWIVSCFPGEWRIHENDGQGGFTLAEVLPAPESGSCALIADFDGDLRADMAMIDELEDVVIVRLNDCYADCDDSGALDVFDFLCYQDAFVAGTPYADCNGAAGLDIFDFLCFQDEFVTACP
jgi:hypothetical protein